MTSKRAEAAALKWLRESESQIRRLAEAPDRFRLMSREDTLAAADKCALIGAMVKRLRRENVALRAAQAVEGKE